MWARTRPGMWVFALYSSLAPLHRFIRAWPLYKLVLASGLSVVAVQ